MLTLTVLALDDGLGVRSTSWSPLALTGWTTAGGRGACLKLGGLFIVTTGIGISTSS